MKARVLEGRGGQARGSADFHEGKGSVTHVGLDTCTPRAMRQATNYFRQHCGLVVGVPSSFCEAEIALDSTHDDEELGECALAVFDFPVVSWHFTPT